MAAGENYRQTFQRLTSRKSMSGQHEPSPQESSGWVGLPHLNPEHSQQHGSMPATGLNARLNPRLRPDLKHLGSAALSHTYAAGIPPRWWRSCGSSAWAWCRRRSSTSSATEPSPRSSPTPRPTDELHLCPAFDCRQCRRRPRQRNTLLSTSAGAQLLASVQLGSRRDGRGGATV